MMDPTALGALTAALEKLANAALQYDPGTRVALGKLAGKSLALESTFPPLTFYLCPQPTNSELSLRVQAFCELPADTHLTGSLPALLALTFGPQHSLANSGVQLSGSSGFLSDFQDVVKNLDVDWEEAINAVIGVTAGHQFSELMRGQMHWAQAGLGKARGFLGDYLTEELRATPARAELEAFYKSVDDLRSDSDRLAARLSKLNERLNPQLDSRQGD
jgi:ubiquinone biosynthesis protein UbiJ